MSVPVSPQSLGVYRDGVPSGSGSLQGVFVLSPLVWKFNRECPYQCPLRVWEFDSEFSM